MPQKLAAGNWKMNGFRPDLGEVKALATAHSDPGCDVVICPPATLLMRMADELADAKIALGGQDCHVATVGAHTGDISATMLAEAGAEYVIVGHSERRADHGEADELIAAKATSALSAGLVPIICVGETLEERDAGRTLEIVGGQLSGSIPKGVNANGIVVAYEPVWAIGTGKVASVDQIAEVHDFLRTQLQSALGTSASDTRLLYGGSVKPGNAAEIFAIENVDGALVGGASLKASDFGAIIDALEAA